MLSIICLYVILSNNIKVSDCCFTPIEQLFSYIMASTNYIRWDDDDVRFVLDQNG